MRTRVHAYVTLARKHSHICVRPSRSNRVFQPPVQTRPPISTPWLRLTPTAFRSKVIRQPDEFLARSQLTHFGSSYATL
jgi:hypothetical protein